MAAVRNNIVFDLDHILVCNHVESIEQANFFQNKGAIVTAIKTHYVFPGVIELLRCVYQIENARISFFSSGIKERNTVLVDALLKRALPEDQYEKVKNTVCVLSKKDLSPSREWYDIAHKGHHKQFGIQPGNYKKDLTKVLRSPDEKVNILDEYKEGRLYDTVLIDDDASFCAPGQPNVLFAPATSNEKFTELLTERSPYDAEGYRPLECVFGQAPSKYDRMKIGRSEQIFISKNEDRFEVHFLDLETNECRIQAISRETNEPLVIQLEATEQRSERGCTIRDQQLVDSIHDVVRSFGGKTKAMCYPANRIYYIAGLLFTALSESQRDRGSILTPLIRLQFKKGEDERCERELDQYGLPTHDRFYHLGLAKLKELNPRLEFTTPRSYRDCVELPVPEADRPLLQAALDNQGKEDCCIM